MSLDIEIAAVQKNCGNFLCSDMYFACAFHDHIIGHNHFTDRIHGDLSALGILDRIHMTADIRIYLGILEGQVGCLHGAVHQLQVLAVAQRLCADNMAINLRQIFR